MMLAGILMALGAVAMLSVDPPDEADESPIVPLGHRRSISVYDRVVVGSDGTPTSRYAVDRAAEVSQAKPVVVTAYRDDDAAAGSTAHGVHRDIYGKEAAQALLDTVGSNPASVIVVGNRGLGASEGQRLGSVPGDVVKNAVCDVIIVQTSALDEDRLFANGSTETGTDGVRSAT